jgi:hypothetical protein
VASYEIVMRHLLPIVFACVILTPSGGCNSTGPNADPGAASVSLSLTKEGKVRFSHADGGGTSSTEKEVGQAGHLFSVRGHYDVMVMLAWPTPKTFEATVEFDSKGAKRALKIDVSGFSEVSATRDDKAVTFPTELPEGKSKVVIKGSCP